MAADEYEVRLTAEDEISDAARDALDSLDKIPDKVSTTVEVDDGSSKRDLETIFGLVDKLGSQSARIVLTDNAKGVQQEIADLLIELDQLDGSDPTVTVKIDQINELEGQLGSIETKVSELGNRPIDISTGSAKNNIDDLGKSADSSKSVLANMVGNATQDLGALGGVAGTAGVAIGQMGEYMADAAASGEGFGSILKNFGKTAIPVAAIGVGVALFTQMITKAQEFGKKVNEASQQAVSALNDVAEAGEDLNTGLDDIAESAVEDIFENLASKAPGAVDALRGLGLGFDDVVAAFRTGKGPLVDFMTEFDRFQTGVALYGEQAATTSFAERLGLSDADAAALIGNLKTIDSAFGEGIEIQGRAGAAAETVARFRADATDATAAAAEAEEEHAAATGRSVTAADALALSADVQAKRAEEAATAMREWATKTQQAGAELDALDDTFAQMGINADSLSALFALGNAPLTAAGEVRDVTIAIGELSEAAKGIKVSDILAGNVKADALLDQLDALRPQIQGKIVEAFAGGGPEAATAMADSYIDQVTAELGGKLPREEVARLLGLSDVEATVKVALELSAIENAKRQLEILTGLNGETPYTASIKLALDAGTITGEQAQALIQAQLGAAGVTIPGAIAVDPASADTALAEFAEREHPAATVPVDADLQDAETDVEGFTDATYDATVDVAGDVSKADTDVESWRTRSRETSPITAVAYTANAEARIREVADKERTAKITVEAGTVTMPSASDLARRIGTVTVPVNLIVGQSIRITGVRD